MRHHLPQSFLLRFGRQLPSYGLPDRVTLISRKFLAGEVAQLDEDGRQACFLPAALLNLFFLVPN